MFDGTETGLVENVFRQSGEKTDMLEGEYEWVDRVLPNKKEKMRGRGRIESKRYHCRNGFAHRWRMVCVCVCNNRMCVCFFCEA